MPSDRDTLADLIYRVGCYDNEDAATAAAALLLAAGVRPPARVIETAEALEALPVGTVVRDGEGIVIERSDNGYAWAAGEGAPMWWAALRLPAIVIWEPKQEAHR